MSIPAWTLLCFPYRLSQLEGIDVSRYVDPQTVCLPGQAPCHWLHHPIQTRKDQQCSWCLVTFSHSSFLHQELCSSPNFQSLTQSVEQHPQDYAHYKFSNDILFFKGRIWINKGNSFYSSSLGWVSQVTNWGPYECCENLLSHQGELFLSGMKHDIS